MSSVCALQAAELFANVSTCLEAIPAMILDDIMAITAQLRTYTDSGVHRLAIDFHIIQLRVCFLRVLYCCHSCVLDRADESIVIDYYALYCTSLRSLHAASMLPSEYSIALIMKCKRF